MTTLAERGICAVRIHTQRTDDNKNNEYDMENEKSFCEMNKVFLPS